MTSSSKELSEDMMLLDGASGLEYLIANLRY